MAKSRNSRSAQSKKMDMSLIKNDVYGKIPPQNIEIEQVVLGACILTAGAFNKIKTIIDTPEVFYKPQHQDLWKAMTCINKRNSPIDILIVREELKKSKFKSFKSQAEVVSYLMDISTMVASDANILSHAQIIYQKYMRRVSILTSSQMIQKAYDENEDIFKTYEFGYKALRKTDPVGVLQMESVNQAANRGSKEPEQKHLLGSILRERDLSFFFGDEGTGKSIFAYQIGDAISRGKSVFEDPNFKNQCEAKKVIMFDFELTARDIYDRYSKEGRSHSFHENFIRVTIDDTWIEMQDMANKITDHIEGIIKEHKPGLAIIDNLTWIVDESTDNSIASKIMKKLDALRKQLAPLSILVIGHTPKRDKSLPLESRHLAGGKTLSNFCTSLFAISESMQDPGFKYIKQLKCRGGSKYFTADNVAVMQIVKPGSILKYDHSGFAKEVEHLSAVDIEEKESEIMDYILDLNDKKYSFRQISDMLRSEMGVSMSYNTVRRKINSSKS